jgi:hypothetical protein
MSFCGNPLEEWRGGYLGDLHRTKRGGLFVHHTWQDGLCPWKGKR